MNVTKKINKLTITTKTIINKLNFSSEIFNSFDDSAIISNNLLSFPIRVKNKKTFVTRYGIKMQVSTSYFSLYSIRSPDLSKFIVK